MKFTTTIITDTSDAQAPKSKKEFRLEHLLGNLFALAIVVGFCWLLLGYVLKGNIFRTGYADWLIQAFRVKTIAENGLVSWTHIWSNGINIWRTYQFIPHVLTAEIVKLTSLSITQAMVILTFIQFILLRLFIFGVVKSQKLSTTTAAIVACSTLTLGQYWSGVYDYSILFGFTIFPLCVGLWIKYANRQLWLSFPFIIGLLFYIHPLVALFSLALWITGWLFSPESRPRIALGLLEILLFIISSSLFWTQYFTGHNANYSAPFFSSLSFLRQTLADYKFLGLSAALVIINILTWLTMPTVLKKYPWVKTLQTFSLLSLFAIAVSQHVVLPTFISSTQFSRGSTFVGITIAIAAAPIIEKIIHGTSKFGKYAITLLCVFICIEAIWTSSRFSPAIETEIEDPVIKLIQNHPEKNIAESRVWTPMLDTANYLNASSTRFPVSYMTHSDSNQIAVHLSTILLYNSFQETVPETSLTRIKEYLYVSGTKFIVFEENSPFTRTLIKGNDSEFEDLGQIELKKSLYHGFEYKNGGHNAMVLPDSQKPKIRAFSEDLNIKKTKDIFTLDANVHDLVQTLSDTNNMPVTVSYATPDSLDITIPAKRPGNTVFIAESYSKQWTAWVNGKKTPLEKAGPNFMSITIPRESTYTLISLKHDWPTSWYISAYAIGITGVILCFTKIIHKYA